MPHCSIEYSANLERQTDLGQLCDRIADALIATGLFPLGGLRVRTVAAEAWVVADDRPENAFADIVLRVGAGRTEAQLRHAGEAVMHAARSHFAPLLAHPHFALSLEIREIGALNWKDNSIHERLRASDGNA